MISERAALDAAIRGLQDARAALDGTAGDIHCRGARVGMVAKVKMGGDFGVVQIGIIGDLFALTYHPAPPAVRVDFPVVPA